MYWIVYDLHSTCVCALNRINVWQWRKCKENTRSSWLLRVCPIQFLILVLHTLIAYIGNDESKQHTNIESSFLTWLCITLNTTSSSLSLSILETTQSTLSFFHNLHFSLASLHEKSVRICIAYWYYFFVNTVVERNTDILLFHGWEIVFSFCLYSIAIITIKQFVFTLYLEAFETYTSVS